MMTSSGSADALEAMTSVIRSRSRGSPGRFHTALCPSSRIILRRCSTAQWEVLEVGIPYASETTSGR